MLPELRFLWMPQRKCSLRSHRSRWQIKCWEVCPCVSNRCSCLGEQSLQFARDFSWHALATILDLRYWAGELACFRRHIPSPSPHQSKHPNNSLQAVPLLLFGVFYALRVPLDVICQVRRWTQLASADPTSSEFLFCAPRTSDRTFRVARPCLFSAACPSRFHLPRRPCHRGNDERWTAFSWPASYSCFRYRKAPHHCSLRSHPPPSPRLRCSPLTFWTSKFWLLGRTATLTSLSYRFFIAIL